MRAFSRQLGAQPGVQLAAIQDRTGHGPLGTWDQTAAIIGRFSRGRIDKPFLVTARNFNTALGRPTPITAASQIGEPHSHVYEALRHGARGVLVRRMTTADADLSHADFSAGAPSGFGVGATPGGATFSVKHLGCFNDGIQIAVHADQVLAAGVPVANDTVTVRVMDADGVLLHQIRGSLTEGAADEFGLSLYLPDVSEKVTDLLQWTIPSGAKIAPTADCYGRDASGSDKWAVSGVLSCFSEGSTAYSAADYSAAVLSLRNAQEDFGYIMGGGTRSVGLIGLLADLAYDTNRQFIFDVPGDYTVAQAIAFMQSLDFGKVGRDHYPQAYWGPFKSLDPLNGNVVVWGTSCTQVGDRCARNSVLNAYGLSQKQDAIAGARGNINRTMYRTLPAHDALSEQDLSDLADARIIPVIYATFAAGSFYTPMDAITAANTSLSYRKLVTVAEMSSWIDEAVVRFGREVLFMNMADGIRKMSDFLQTLLTNCMATGWLVESDDGSIKPFVYEVRADDERPADTMRVTYWLHYNGMVRQVHVQQIIV